MRKKLLLVFATSLLLFASACGNDKTSGSVPEEDSIDSLTVYTTVYPLTYFTERIGGELVNVSSIYPAGANEHTFEPTQRDMIALADADLFLYVGLGLEGFVDKAKQTLKNEKVRMVAAADSISDAELEAAASEGGHDHHHDHADEGHEGHEGHDHGDIDPHVWISPVLSQKLSLAIKDALVEEDPENESFYTENYNQLIYELQELDGQFKEMAASATNKTFFVSHAAFGYIAEPYGLEQIAIAGLNSQDEPSQKELTKIVDLAREHNVNYILFEQNVSSKTAKVIQNEIGAESLVLHNLGVLTEEDIKNGETYFTLMEHNLEVLKTALN